MGRHLLSVGRLPTFPSSVDFQFSKFQVSCALWSDTMNMLVHKVFVPVQSMITSIVLFGLHETSCSNGHRDCVLCCLPMMRTIKEKSINDGCAEDRL